MSNSTEISLSVGADLSSLLAAMKEMVESVKNAAEAVRNNFESMSKSGKTLERTFVYAADGSRIYAEESGKTASALKDQSDAFSECRESIQKMILDAKKFPSSAQKITVSVKDSKSALLDFANTTTAIRNSFRIVTAAISGVASALSAPLSQFSRYEDAATRLSPLVGGLGEANGGRSARLRRRRNAIARTAHFRCRAPFLCVQEQ